MQHLAHWDEVEGARGEAGHIGGTWRDLGTATGTAGVGLARGIGVIGRIEQAGYWDGEP